MRFHLLSGTVLCCQRCISNAAVVAIIVGPVVQVAACLGREGAAGAARSSCALPVPLLRTGTTPQVGQKMVCNSTSIPSGSSKTIQFQYKYVLGSCSKKGQGTGPTLSLAIGSKEVWTKQINIATEDYPYETSCGGSPTAYSPVRTATFTVKGPMTGAVVLKAKQSDRNIRVVGLGMNYAGLWVGSRGDGGRVWRQ